MTVETLKKKWLWHYIKPKYFYIPVRETNNGLGEPLIVDIIITDGAANQSINYFSYCSGWSNVCVNLLTRCITESGDIVTQEKYPQYFNSTGKHITSYDTSYKIYYNMTPDLYMNFDEGTIGYVDWGDGSTLEPIAFTYTVPTSTNMGLWDGVNDSSKILAKQCYMKFSSGCKHTYTSAGRYRIKIYGKKIPHVMFNRGKIYFDVARVVQWGELDYKSTSLMFGSNLFDVDSLLESLPTTGWEVFRNVKSTSGMFYGIYTVSWDMIPKDIMKYFPAVVDASYMFHYTRCNEIPAYFTVNNPELMYIDNMFYGAQVESIGDYAFANLNKLVSATYVIDSRCSIYFSGMQSDTLRSIGDSVFENCINLETNLTYIFGVQGNIEGYHGLDTVGSYVFKNCKKIITSGAGDIFGGNWYLKSIGDGVFEGCESITNMLHFCYCCFSLASVGRNLFKGCTNLRTIYEGFKYNYNLTSVGSGMFRDCVNLQNISGLFYSNYRLPTIPADLFSGCRKLNDICLVFYNCISLSYIPTGLLADVVYDGINKINIGNFAYSRFVQKPDGSLELEYYNSFNQIEINLAGMFNQTDIVLTAVGDIFDGHISNFAGAIVIGSAFNRSMEYVYISESDDTHIVYENYYCGKTSGSIPDWWNQIATTPAYETGCFGYINADYSKTHYESRISKTVTNNYHITNPAAVSVPSEFTPTSNTDNQTWLFYMGL